MNAAENEIIVRALLFILEDSSSDSSTDSSSDSELSDSESDEDGAFSHFYAMPIVPLRNRDIPRMEAYAENIVPKMMEKDFVSHFRLNRRTVEAVGNMIMRDPQLIKLSSLTLWKQLLMTLWIVGSPESFRSVADRFDVSKSVLWLAVTHTCAAIARLSTEIIRWPSSTDMRASEQSFLEMCGFPGVIGCIDGTHIEIAAPVEYSANYVNRLDYHSMVLQGVANSRLQFIDCYVGEVGAVHDARVFANSDIGRHLSDIIPSNFHLLGDAAYALQINLLTPFRDNGHLTRRQLNYNHKLSKTRCTIERAFGLLKGRFRRLKYLYMLRTDLVPTIIMACCVLHNLVITDKIHTNQGDYQDGDNEEEDDDDERPQDDENTVAAEKRRNIMNML